MKNISILLGALYFHLSVKSSSACEAKSCALGKVIGSLLTLLNNEFPSKIVSINMNKDNAFLDDVQNEILRSTEAPTQIFNYRATSKYEAESFSYVHLTSVEVTLSKLLESQIEYFERLVQVNSKLNRRVNTYQRNFILTFMSNASADIQQFESINMSTSTYHFIVKTYENGSLGLFQRVFFGDEKCGSTLKMLNSFNMTIKRWRRELFFFRSGKISFTNCSLPIYQLKQSHGNFSFLHRLNMVFLDIFGERFNLNFASSTNNQTPHIYILNEGMYLADYERNDPSVFLYFHLTFPLAIRCERFAVTKGLPYSPTEKMILPFDQISWILIITTLLIGIAAIVAITMIIPKDIAELLIGNSTAHPLFNLVSIFFGIGMIRVPNENCARFLLMIFILYCIVIRTAYQGKMFEFMTGDMRKPTPKTFKELVEREIPILDPVYESNKEDGKLIDSVM